jgi:hypothetical protein
MKIEEGKKYVRRDGNITGEMKGRRVDSCTLSEYKFIDSMNNEVYTSDGNYFAYEFPSGADLIKEYKPKNKMKDTVKVKKQFLLDGHKEACQSWKERIEKEAPELFEKLECKFKISDWIVSNSGHLYCISNNAKNVNVENISFGAYGFSLDGLWVNSAAPWSDNSSDWKKATEQEVEAALIKEAKKRGYMEAFSIKDLSFGGIIEVGCEKTFKPYASNDLWLNNANENVCIFREGKWAEIVEEKKPELVKGEWYKTLLGNGDISILFNFQKEDSRGILCGYGLNVFADKWFDSVAWTSKEYSKLTKVTKEEISSMLIAEAKRRGFKEGVTWYTIYKDSQYGTRVNKENGGVFSYDKEGLCLDNNYVFRKGEWASIIPAKDKNDSLKASVKALEEQLKELKRQIG